MYFTSKGILKNLCFFWCDWFVGMVINSKMLLIVVVFRHQDTMMCGFGRSTSCRRPSIMGDMCSYCWFMFESFNSSGRSWHGGTPPQSNSRRGSPGTWETTCFNHNALLQSSTVLRSRSSKKQCRFICGWAPFWSTKLLKIVCWDPIWTL